ncbi:hypothetical protein MLD38_025362 [Melastoma candidum]|uniref:Uncharacterized protein n=1 Tax=Melastoma candidum TaxID=119954 RepID=A0ACB9NWQ8_9MYRT|nr:hypothetical protein MLD38_025362 [Melastoma candidum]
MGKMNNLKQEGEFSNLYAYMEEFDICLRRVLDKIDLPMSFQVSLFINGLKEEFKSTLWLLKPIDLFSVQANNRPIVPIGEQRVSGTRDKVINRVDSTSSASGVNRSGEDRGVNAASVSSSVSSNVGSVGRRRLSQEEVEERRMKGLCFGCNEPFDRNHRCSRQQVYSMILEPIEEGVGIMEGCTTDVGEQGKDRVQVTLHALKGELKNEGVQTMQVKGLFKEKSLNILIDSRSTHNFVDIGMVKGMNLLVETVPPIGVLVADGRSMVCRNMLRQFCWEMQGHTFTADFYVISLGGCEMILGVTWLAELGDIVWNFHLSMMKFTWEGVEVVLVGESHKGQQGMLQATTVRKMQKICSAPVVVGWVASVVGVEESLLHCQLVQIGKELPKIEGVLAAYADLL